VASLTKLAELDLTNNQLVMVPAEVGLLPLRSLGVEAGPYTGSHFSST
jgi:Leucine-rich repeat (LRR) protein